jgi:hypothetical protein
MRNAKYVWLHLFNVCLAFIALVLGTAMFPSERDSFELYLIFMGVTLLSGIYLEIADYAEQPRRRRYR